MKYTFIMPVYNSSFSLKKSIDSVINQNYPNWELIAVDDGSTDESFLILKDYAKKDSRIKCFTKKNSGPGDTRNFAFKHVSGDYIAFLDSDDYYEPTFLSNINDVISKNKYDVIFISTFNEYADGRIYNCDNLFKYKNCSKNELISFQMSGKLPWGPCSKIIKSEFVRDCRFSKIPVGEESIYSFDVLCKANSIYFLEKPMYHYVHNENGQHKTGGVDPWYSVVHFMEEHLKEKDLLGKYKMALSSLAINSLIISLYRMANEDTLFSAYKNIKIQIKKYKNEFEMDKYDKKCLNTKSKIIYFLVKIHFYMTIIIISKLRNKYLNRNGD